MDRFDGLFTDLFSDLDLWNDIKNAILGIEIKDFLDIILVSVLLFYALRLIRDTRAIQLVKGFAVIALAYFLVNLLQLKTMRFILDGVISLGLIAFAVVFQPELRRALEQVGRIRIPIAGLTESDTDIRTIRTTITILCDSAAALSAQKIGALIVLERQTRLGEIISTGTVLDARVSEQLIGNVFYPKSPLHDGAAVFRGNRIVAAGCFLPISENMSISKELGTRHRAALGMSENSDALILVVSEETGDITIAEAGRLWRKLDAVRLRGLLEKGLLPDTSEDSGKRSFWRVRNNGK